MLDQDRRVLELRDVMQIDGVQDIGEIATVSENLYGILVEKSEGEAALRVNSGEPGDGIAAYMRIYLWFAGTTALALTERTQRVMSPNPVKHEAELADAIERWA